MVAFPSDFVRTRRPMYIGQRVEVVHQGKHYDGTLRFIKPGKSKKYGVQCDSDEDKTTTWVDDSDIYAIHLKKNDFVYCESDGEWYHGRIKHVRSYCIYTTFETRHLENIRTPTLEHTGT